ncbi:leucyl-tRNA synthetase [Haloactinopolyspora alba]|uniref:Leucine--tRNA ligase n=1 Tax=Haloactinopolyspora alba TaxID=648780 RepID=A0A2P8EBS7_9ACTN|nr:leucine--tRNA ligase [Haloactinopolyspora alba]PSL06900.1 leucyl-tRNA synthetase [Haloactinopolyspora alba]
MRQTQTGTTATGDDGAPFRYTSELASRIEQRWQDHWETQGTFNTPNPEGELADPDADVPSDKFFLMDMFPYPSGKGLHVGHPLGYIATDVLGRFKRMCGDNVLHALSYDAFGLPAEQYAVQTGQHPRKTTEENIVNMRRQLRRLGLAHDDRRSFATTDPGYIRWTQWIFLQIFDSWYDTEADGGRGRARPIDELVKEFDSGERPVPGGRAWVELDESERRRVVDEHRLAYVSESPVNWCPGLGTVLSNEEVTAEGRSERGNFPVFQRNLRQWMMRITAYADRLVDDLDRIDWPEKVRTMQRNWIGRSAGATVRFATDAGDLDVFTTRPDTLFGATFMVVAPEHPLVDGLTAASWPEETNDAWSGGHPTPAEAVAAYRAQAAAKTDVERQTEGRDKTGVFTGSFAVNPVDGNRIPVFVADYVLMGYGTGAIMAVPGQDERDWEFAERFELPIVRTVRPPDEFDGEAYTGDGPAINSSNDQVSLDGLYKDAAIAAIVEWLEKAGHGTGTTTYRLRDWLFSRQRYWGEPFPIVHDETGPIAVPDDQLPVLLPEVPDYAPKTYDADDADSTPESPLARSPEWAEVELDLGDGPKRYRRDTNTMPNWAGSCWYHLRYLDPTNDEQVVDPEIERYWMGPQPQRRGSGPQDPGGVDLYIGGVEHAVLHLLYARFWHKVLFDLGHVSSDEPYYRLFNQGYIQAYAYADRRGQYVPAEQVTEAVTDGATSYSYEGEPVSREYGKMGKSLKNIVTPDDMYDEFGADTFRVYEMSMGPLDQSRPWETRAVIGSHRFLQRVWRNVISEEAGATVVSDEPAGDETRRILHRTIDAVRADMDAMRFNTAVARMIELNNHLTKLDTVPREAAEPLVLMVAPVAPHVAEEMWSLLGHDRSLAYEPFPVADPALLVDETVTCVVQVAGKVRDRLQVPPSADDDMLRELALASEPVQRALDGQGVRKVIVRAPKLVNVVPG